MKPAGYTQKIRSSNEEEVPQPSSLKQSRCFNTANTKFVLKTCLIPSIFTTALVVLLHYKKNSWNVPSTGGSCPWRDGDTECHLPLETGHWYAETSLPLDPVCLFAKALHKPAAKHLRNTVTECLSLHDFSDPLLIAQKALS